MTLAVQPHNWHFVCFWNATQTTQQKLALHKEISIGAGLSLRLYFKKKVERESWVTSSACVSQAWREYGHCTSVFAFGFFGDVKQTVHQTLLVVGIIKKTWYKLWYVQNECTKELAQNDKWKHYREKCLFFFLMVQFVTYANWTCDWVDQKW